MSAFHDIWIGNEGSTPCHKRLENSEWQKESFGSRQIYFSQPQKEDSRFVHKTTVGDYTIIVLGQFYETVDMKALTNRCAGYVEGTVDTFDDPAGHYIIFMTDTRRKQHHVFTNRFGTYHAYWMNDGSQRTIGTYYMGMARQSGNKDLDWEGITGFLGMGYFPNDKTYLNTIKIFSPASWYCFSHDLELLKAKKYWNWTNNSQDVPEALLMEQLHEMMKQSLSYSLANHRVALPVSGGLDSRMLAGDITTGNKQYASAWAYSYGYTDNSIETAIGQKIAKARNIPFDKYKVPNYLFDKIGLLADSVEMFQYIDGTRQACMKEVLEDKSDVVVGGHWGDVWMDSPGIEDIPGNDPLMAAFRKKIVKKGSDWLLTNISAEYLKEPKQYLYDYFNSTINKYSHIQDNNLQFKAYKTDEWSFRWTLASIRMYQAAVFPVLPFYDRRISSLCLQIPSQSLNGRKFQIDYIKRYHPDLARIKWQEYGRNLYSYKHLNNRSIIYRAIKKLERTIKNEKPIIRNWEIFYLNPEGRANLEAHLLDNKLLNDIIGTEKIKQLLDQFYNEPSGGNGYTVSMMLTFSQAIKKIFD